jgi:hypothetical protein
MSNTMLPTYASPTRCRKLLESLELGPITNMGGPVFDVNMKYVCSRWELIEILKELRKYRIELVARVSSGVQTWSLQ